MFVRARRRQSRPCAHGTRRAAPVTSARGQEREGGKEEGEAPTADPRKTGLSVRAGEGCARHPHGQGQQQQHPKGPRRKISDRSRRRQHSPVQPTPATLPNCAPPSPAAVSFSCGGGGGAEPPRKARRAGGPRRSPRPAAKETKRLPPPPGTCQQQRPGRARARAVHGQHHWGAAPHSVLLILHPGAPVPRTDAQQAGGRAGGAGRLRSTSRPHHNRGGQHSRLPGGTHTHSQRSPPHSHATLPGSPCSALLRASLPSTQSQPLPKEPPPCAAPTPSSRARGQTDSPNSARTTASRNSSFLSGLPSHTVEPVVARDESTLCVGGAAWERLVAPFHTAGSANKGGQRTRDRARLDTPVPLPNTHTRTRPTAGPCPELRRDTRHERRASQGRA